MRTIAHIFVAFSEKLNFSLDKMDILRNTKSYTYDFLRTNPPLYHTH